jgi:pimeloyl-ACP methyl ester carboxylesterase
MGRDTADRFASTTIVNHGNQGSPHLTRPESWLVLVPGLACDAAVWQPVLPALTPHARTWVPAETAHEHVGAMAEALLRDAPAEHFALAGHSLGGRIALEVLRRAPQRVQGLALLDTGWQPLPAGEAGERECAQRRSLVDLARHEGMRAMGERWVPGMLHPAHVGTSVHAQVLSMVEGQSVERFAAQQQALMRRPDAADVLGTIACPTLVLCGREDAWSPLSRHEELAARIRGARLAVVAQCGHMSTMEQPQAVGAVLATWLQGRHARFVPPAPTRP